MKINITQPDFTKICPACLGSGKVKAMQSYMTYDAGSVRGPDTKVTCPSCKGTGRNSTESQDTI
jgi:DnaJ-class molecular chaperone